MDNQPRMYIDMDKVASNIKYLVKDKQPCLAVKANQYHVLENLEPLINLGYKFYGVSTLDEALNIINSFSDVEVLIFTPIEVDIINEYAHTNIHFTVVDINTLNQVDKQAKVHLNFDTGMGRIGFTNQDITEIVSIIKTRGLEITGIYSHFPCADIRDYTYLQIERFHEIINTFTKEDINFKYIHIQNTLGCVLYDIPWCNMVRPGIGIWGYCGNLEEANMTSLQPALKLEAPVAFEKNYEGYIGYGHIEKVHGEIATIKMGYNDGLVRRLRGYDFKPGKVVGNVCMCQTMLLLPNKDIDTITIFDGDSLYTLCDYIDESVYEFLCGLSFRIKRILINEGE